jgi:hypothetical protein
VAPVADLFAAFILIVPAWLLAQVRRFGMHQLPLTKKALLAVGVFPIRDHYYEPAFHPRHFTKDLTVPRVLPGIDLREEKQLELLSSFHAAGEMQGWMEAGPGSSHTAAPRVALNSTFGPGDAEFLYQFLRYTKPARVVEIGSGNSTRVAHLALRKNEEEGAAKAVHTCIEPYEMPWLEQLGPKILRAKVEDTPVAVFEALESGDLLFIDSSHMIRPQGDVLHEYLNILPRLKKGVYIHVHDIFTPRDYPQHWIVDEVRFWNEQYLLEAMLACSTRYRVIAAVNWLKHEHFEELSAVCPFVKPRNEPGSIYIQVS